MLTFSLVLTGVLMGTMIFFGWVFQYHPPKNVNYIYGYRTPRSTQNEDTWLFAHKTAGKIWMKQGIFGFVFSVILILLLNYNGSLEESAMFIFYGQLIVLFLVVPMTERQLKKHFNKDGTKK